MAQGQARPRAVNRRPRRWILIGMLIGAGVLLLVVANAHLVYVAMVSQPACVPHPTATDGAAGTFRAAKPAC